MFLSGDELSNRIKQLMRKPNLRCAVAFWGKGSAEKIISPEALVICNLSAGGSNPKELKKLAEKVTVRQLDELHAKVYLAGNDAIICSANASANGLGLEGDEQSLWIEAGSIISDTETVGDWFDMLWENARPISELDWKTAEQRWRKRQQYKPSLPTFENFDIDDERLPFLEWHGHKAPPFELVDSSIEAVLGELNDTTKFWLLGGVPVKSDKDTRMLINSWVLTWGTLTSGKPKKNSLYWRATSDLILPGGARSGEGKWNLIAPARPSPPRAF